MSSEGRFKAVIAEVPPPKDLDGFLKWLTRMCILAILGLLAFLFIF